MNASRISLAAPLTLAFAALACSGGTPQPPPAGTLKIVTKGGTATTGPGGLGGAVTVSGSGGGPLQLLQTGLPDASFTVDTAQPALGANPKTIATSTTLVVNDPANPVNGDTVATQPATGLWVKPGITLTLQPFVGATSTLNLTSGVLVEGTLTATRNPAGDATSITITCANLLVTTAGIIDLSGLDSGVALGGAGGTFQVTATGAIAHAGKFTAKGGAGVGGGPGGSFGATSSVSIVASSGTIDVSGGSGTTGAGGPGGTAGSIAAFAQGDVGSSGALTARGGDGTTGGGDGGFVILQSIGAAARSSSAITTSGGSATVGGNGGTAGTIGVQSAGRDLLVTGSLQAQGGAGAGAGGVGGSGSSVSLARAPASVSGSLLLAAGIDTSGGSGTAGGGSAGGVTVNGSSGTVFPDSKQYASLLGYASIDTSGGGGTVGRTAGNVSITQSAAFSQPGNTTLYTDDVRNEVPITAKGGAGSAGNGGRGGNVSFRNTSVMALPTTHSTVNVADIDASGGTGTAAGGGGGTVSMSDQYQVSNQGKVNTTAGNGGTGNGGSGGALSFTAADGTVENLGELQAAGGSSTGGNGGSGGDFNAQGNEVTAAQNFTGNGGASTTARGGFGGDVVLLGVRTGTLFSGTLSVKAGTSVAGFTPAPTDGLVLIDGVTQALTGGQYTK
jgi:hypothetical protein